MAKRKSTKGQKKKKKTYTTYYMKHRVTLTPLKPGVKSDAPYG